MHEGSERGRGSQGSATLASFPPACSKGSGQSRAGAHSPPRPLLDVTFTNRAKRWRAARKLGVLSHPFPHPHSAASTRRTICQKAPVLLPLTVTEGRRVDGVRRWRTFGALRHDFSSAALQAVFDRHLERTPRHHPRSGRGPGQEIRRNRSHLEGRAWF